MGILCTGPKKIRDEKNCRITTIFDSSFVYSTNFLKIQHKTMEVYIDICRNLH